MEADQVYSSASGCQLLCSFTKDTSKDDAHLRQLRVGATEILSGDHKNFEWSA